MKKIYFVLSMALTFTSVGTPAAFANISDEVASATAIHAELQALEPQLQIAMAHKTEAHHCHDELALARGCARAQSLDCYNAADIDCDLTGASQALDRLTHHADYLKAELSGLERRLNRRHGQINCDL